MLWMGCSATVLAQFTIVFSGTDALFTGEGHGYTPSGGPPHHITAPVPRKIRKISTFPPLESQNLSSFILGAPCLGRILPRTTRRWDVIH